MGVRWYGVPYPIRRRLSGRLTGPLDGCGCIKALKDLWERLRNDWRDLNWETCNGPTRQPVHAGP